MDKKHDNEGKEIGSLDAITKVVRALVRRNILFLQR